MMRKPELIRAILERVETDQQNGPIDIPEIIDFTDVQVRHHVELCEEAGYIHLARDRRTDGIRGIRRLTWNGHEALDDYRAAD